MLTRLAEPDLRVDFLGSDAGIAAERVRSTKQLSKRAKEAAEQIKTSGIPGIVALNVDVLLRAKGTSVEDMEQLEERLLALKEIGGLLSRHEQVVGLLEFSRDSSWRFDREIPAVDMPINRSFTVYERTRGLGERAAEWWRKVNDLIEARMANL